MKDVSTTLCSVTAAVLWSLLGVAAPASAAVEQEPNDTATEATSFTVGEAGTGSIGVAGDVDYWRLDGVSSGDRVFAYVDVLDSDDPKLTLISADEVSIVEVDDNSGPLTRSLLAGSVLFEDGVAYLKVQESGDNRAIANYRLVAVFAGSDRVVPEREPNEQAGTIEPAGAAVVAGIISTGDLDLFAVSALAGDTIDLLVDDDPDDDDNLTDTELHLFHFDGLTRLAAGDNFSTSDANATRGYVVPEDGTYLARIGNGTFGGGDRDYLIVALVNGALIEVCGDGLVASGEQCDDGDLRDIDGCSSICEIEPEPDGGFPVDAGPPDGGPLDGGPPDGGSSDAGPIEGGDAMHGDRSGDSTAAGDSSTVGDAISAGDDASTGSAGDSASTSVDPSGSPASGGCQCQSASGAIPWMAAMLCLACLRRRGW